MPLYTADPLAIAPIAVDTSKRDLVSTRGEAPRARLRTQHGDQPARKRGYMRALHGAEVRRRWPHCAGTCISLRLRRAPLADEYEIAQGAMAECLSVVRVLSTVQINFPTVTVGAADDADEWLDDDFRDREEVPVILKVPEARAIVRRCP
ncbi:hypothetical protein MVEN_01730900 [Mycena venus]|uniref:Uncharacterized protein n=1 Tax=Mycena venus TaxID=2733690 RepID=A0A8H6XK04_9AGAR|nr:hypothetical protein MVEN_01730900 [Mycena venus]